jgi:hypothetical protein
MNNTGNKSNLNSAMNNTGNRNNLNSAMNNTGNRNNLNSMVKNAGNRNNLNSAMNNTERRNNLNPAMNNTERRNNLNSAMNNIGNRNDRKVNFPNESIFKSQPKPDFLKTRETGNSQTSAVRFGDVFQKSTPSFLKRVRRTDPQPKSNVFNNSGPGPAIPMGPNVPNPLPVKPNGSNVPTPVKPNGSNVPTPVKPNGSNVPTPVKPNGSNVPTPVKPNGSNVPTPVKPNGSNVPTPVKPNGSNVPTPVKPNGSNAPKPKPFIFGSSNGVSDLKSTLKKKLKTLKKLRSDEMNMFLAKVSKLENLDDIFEEARQKDQQRYTEESELIEKKIRNAKTNKERKIAIAENRRIKQEKAAANIQAKKNVAALKRDERKINLSNRSNAIKNAKRALKTNLDSLKQLSRSERNSYLSRVKTVENVDDVFISASQLDQKRYDQKIQNAENKVSKARTEKERLEAKKEKNRLEREQNEEERKARKKAKQLRNQSVRNKLNNTRVQQKIEKLNTNSAIKTAALEAKTRNKKIQTAKNSLKRNLGSLKKLTTSERMAYLSRVRALENIDDVFAEAQRLDQERYDQQLADLKQKNSQVRDEKERKRIAIESRRVIKEQEMAKIQATKNLKRMRELNRSYKNEERKQNIINKKRNDNSKLPVAPIVPPMADIVKPNKPFNAMGKFQNAGKRVGNLVKGFNLKKKSAEPNTEKKPFNAKNKFKGAIGKIGAMKAFKPNTVAKNKFNAKNKFKGAIGKIGAMKAFKPNTVAKNKFNAKNKFKGAVGKIGAMKAFKPNVVTKNKFKPNLNTINEKKPFNAKSKFKGAVSAVTAFKPENTFDAAAELDKQLNIKGKELNKANTNKKIRDGVEFKLKQINGLTNTDVTEFMTKWNKSKNKVIFNQARKRGAGRLNGKAKTEERAKPKEENNFNTAAEMNKLNLAPTKNRLLKKAKNEVGRFAGRIGKWDPAIKNAKSNVTLTDLEKQLDKKIELRKEIQMSKLGPIKKRGHLEKVMELRNDVGQRRRIFEEQLKNLTLNTKKKELTKYIIGLNLPAENKSRYVKQTNKPGANLNLIRRSANKQVEEKISNTSKSLVAGAIKKAKNDEAATKIQAAFRGKKNRNKVARMKFEKKTNVTNTFIPTGFDESKVFDNPLAVKPTRTFKDVVKNNKKRRVMNNVKTAAKIAAEKKKLSEATGAERVRLSREQSAATSRNKGKNATAAAGLLKKRNNQFATKGISKAAALKAEQKRAEAAAKKQAKKNKVQEALKAQKARGEALKAKRATKEREEKQKKAVREAAERSAAALKKAASKMEEKEKKRKAGPARNAKLAKELGISKKAAKKRRPKPK